MAQALWRFFFFLFDLFFNFLSWPKALFYCLLPWSKIARWDDVHSRNNSTKILTTEASVLVSFLLLVCFVLLQALSLSGALCCPASPRGFAFHLLLIKLTPDYSGKEKQSWWRNDVKGKSKTPEQCIWVTISFLTRYSVSLALGGGGWKCIGLSSHGNIPPPGGKTTTTENRLNLEYSLDPQFSCSSG